MSDAPPSPHTSASLLHPALTLVRFSPSGDFFVSVSNDMKGLIFDGKTGDKIGELNQDKASKHGGSIYSCCFSADRSPHPSLHQTLISHQPVPHHPTTHFVCRSTKLATVSADKTVKVWAIPSGDLIGAAARVCRLSGCYC
jgi:WD40 repeat protein